VPSHLMRLQGPNVFQANLTVGTPDQLTTAASAAVF
jgi:hypothetical protein